MRQAISAIRQQVNPREPAIRDALCGSESMCRFAGIDIAALSLPGATSTLQFRRLL